MNQLYEIFRVCFLLFFPYVVALNQPSPCFPLVFLCWNSPELCKSSDKSQQ